MLQALRVGKTSQGEDALLHLGQELVSRDSLTSDYSCLLYSVNSILTAEVV